ncbi:type II toxin-antitoxin system RelE/ParE family toxin [Mesorhizobium sp. M2C.T.Ca.TU.002.02.1.1]|uniref:type II toxin-antitoxin system RelE/ParE family toxin n=1 Tax=Mesorhizobium sp. M2C.T.Ca.TU.002.02.1.1 TaxID=2496788 RepID=UPI001FE16DCC|nr:type II toxin-antitoxin system RelE/ParE family toxin [Mesorhizobium sp. M2C.T.Ca.TU.002.02.1.1]
MRHHLGCTTWWRSPFRTLRGLRSVAFQKYVIFYTVEGDDVRVERILHGSRDIQGIFDEGRMPKDS